MQREDIKAIVYAAHQLLSEEPIYRMYEGKLNRLFPEPRAGLCYQLHSRAKLDERFHIYDTVAALAGRYDRFGTPGHLNDTRLFFLLFLTTISIPDLLDISNAEMSDE